MRFMRRWSGAALLAVMLLTAPALAEILGDPVTYVKEVVEGGDRYVFRNRCSVPVSIKLSLELTNVAVTGLHDLIEIPANGTVVGPTFRRANPAMGGWNYRWTYRYNFGAYTVSRPSEPFDLPWAVGESREVGQAFGGDRSHTGDDKYAVDFPMPEGTPIYASREGLVCYMRENLTEGGWKPELRDKDNHVMLAHADGTISRYLHLRHMGSVVELGQWVEKGELLGYSGNVGFSSGPHLHFDVVRPGRDLVTQTIPFEFLSNGEAVIPEEHMLLSH